MALFRKITWRQKFLTPLFRGVEEVCLRQTRERLQKTGFLLTAVFVGLKIFDFYISISYYGASLLPTWFTEKIFWKKYYANL
jgi:hypothetical protein